jgi:hypothetical protein
VSVVHCVYVDVDRRYYHSNAGVPIGARYAEINVQPGYQRLCGQHALSYVRFRHADNDLVRAARQQDFLRAAGDELSTSSILGHLNRMVKAFARATSSDANLQSATGILRLLHLAAGLTGHPVRQVRFPATLVNSPVAPVTTNGITTTTATGLGDYVTATPDQIHRAVQRFLHPPTVKRITSPPSAGRTAGTHRKKAAPPAPADYGLVYAFAQVKTLVKPQLRAHRLRIPFYGPRWLTPRGRYPASTSNAPMPRIYSVADRSGHKHQAYRLVVAENVTEGQYYGVQGIAWPNAPILQAASTTLKIGRRTFELFYDGQHLRVVAWRTAKAAYWVSNTLTRSLSNREMLGIARSLTRIRR